MSEKYSPEISGPNFVLLDPPQKRNGFVLVDGQEDLRKKILDKVSFTTGNLNSDSTLREVVHLINSIRNPLEHRFRFDLYKKYIKLPQSKNRSPGQKTTVMQRYEQTIDKYYNHDFKRESYGVSMPSYLEELKLYRDRNPQEICHKSLLIGCLSVDTAQEFIGTVSSVFNESKTDIIDIDNKEISGEIPNFQIMDGMNTTFKSNSFNTIHTNFLLHQLSDGSNVPHKDLPDKEKHVRKLFKEIYRLLSHGGELIMIEGNFSSILNADNPGMALKEIKSSLIEAGFTNLQIKPAQKFSDPQGLFIKMQSSPGSQINTEEGVCTSLTNAVITATKP